MRTPHRLILILLLGLLWLAAAPIARAAAPTPTPTPRPAAAGAATPAASPTPAPTATRLPDITPPAPSPPAGFVLVDVGYGVALYRKDYPNGSPDFIQVVDLGRGARLELMHGPLQQPRPDKGSFGGPDPSMNSPALSTFWSQLKSADPGAFCVANGGFFYMPEYPTRLAFPLKVNGQIITEGWGKDTYLGEHQILELWDDHAEVEALNQFNLYGSGAPDILGGLTEHANKRAKFAVGRTFVGLLDHDGDGLQETVLLLTTRTATQAAAAAALREFGAAQVMMLDGGGSTQLLCKSGYHIQSDRPVPQAVGVVAGRPPAVQIELVDAPGWTVLAEGQSYPLQVEIRNSGLVTWTAETAEVVIKPGPLGVAYTLPVEGSVPPGTQAVFSDTLTAYRRAGIYPVEIEWGIVYQGKLYPGPQLNSWAVVLPEALQAQRPALQAELQGWLSEPPERIEQRIDAWVNARLATPQPMQVQEAQPAAAADEGGGFRSSDVLWVPLLMLPIVVLLGVIIARRSR
ncbi:MAG: phosphodiester glycosidase family protein [Chloroflexota bacterium]